jgi:predicted acylesterase/phospholipase RssA
MNYTPSPGNPRVNLALQGGGSHGAFTWGVLDALLDDGRVSFEGISGTSAGAMNAVALAHGFAQAEGKTALQMRESARASLQHFWDGVVDMGAMGNSISQAQRAPFDILFGGFAGLMGQQSPGQMVNDAMTSFWSKSVSPYQSNPLDINPLQKFLEAKIDFERLAAFKALKVFVVATTVTTGKAEVFSGKRLSAKAVMASACLPAVFRAVEIDGEHYWDGGFSGNPAMHPLIYECNSRDIVLVQINPIKRDKLPTTAGDILDRVERDHVQRGPDCRDARHRLCETPAGRRQAGPGALQGCADAPYRRRRDPGRLPCLHQVGHRRQTHPHPARPGPGLRKPVAGPEICLPGCGLQHQHRTGLPGRPARSIALTVSPRGVPYGRTFLSKWRPN